MKNYYAKSPEPVIHPWINYTPDPVVEPGKV
jgi:hypothetical protein